MMQNQNLSLALLLWSVKRASATADHEAKDRESSLIIALLCAAFSTEIGMKAILQSQRKTAEGHDLGAIYRQLPQAVQSSILERGGFSDIELRHRLENLNTSCTALESMYESHGIETAVNFLQKLASAVHTELENGRGSALPNQACS